jgi:outer membrane protein assembly factor BamB
VIGGVAALAAAVAVVAVVAVTGRGGGRAAALASVLRPDGIAILDARDGHLVTQAPAGGRTGNEATGTTLFAYGSVWALAENGTITQVDPETGEVEHRYPLAKAPTGMAAGRGDVWVVFYDAAVLVRIQPLTHTTVEVPLPARHRRGPGVGAGGIAIGAGAVWVTRPGRVERLDPVTGRVVARIALPGALSIVVAAGGVWAASRDAGILSRIDPRTNRITARVTLPANVCCLASAPNGVFASSEAPGLVTWISRDGRVEGSFHLPGAAADLAYAAGRLWVSGLGSGRLTSIDVASGAQHTYDAGTTVAGVAASGNRVAFGINTDARSMLARVRGPVARVLLPTDLIADIDPATPGVNGSAPFARFVARATCAGLFTWPDRPAPDGATLVPELSRDGGSVSADGLTWTFHVRTGYRFSPPARTAVTARTVADTIERALSPELKPAPAARLLSDVVGVPAYRARRASHLAGVQARDDVVEIRLRRPVPDLPDRLASSVFCVVPDGTPAVSGGVLDPLPAAGPYYVAARAGGVFEVLLRNPAYHGPRPNRFAGFGFDLASDPVRAIARVRNGSADLVVSAKPGAGLASIPLLVTDVLRVSGALRRNSPLRHAIADALDRRALADVLNGVPADRLLPPALARGAGGPAGARPPRSDRAAGTVTVGTCHGACTTLADEIARELSRAGLRARTTARRPELALERIEALDPDPADFLALALGRAAPRALATALALSGSAREAAARAVDVRLTRAAVIIPLSNPVTAEARSRRLGCVHVDPFEPGTDLAALCPDRNSS